MEKTNTTPITIHFGKGEYAVTSKNVERLEKAVNEFTETGVWKWMLVDCLGIKADGTVGKRYDDVVAGIKNVPACNGLYTALTNYKAPTVEITRTHRATAGSSSQKNMDEIKRIAETIPAQDLFTAILGDEEMAREVIQAIA